MRLRKRAKIEGLRESPHLLEALQVAYYHCILEMPLKNIAELLGKSPATITRRLDEVRQAGWLRDRPEFNPPPDIWKELQGKMTCARIEKALIDHFGHDLLTKVSVLPSPVRQDASKTRVTASDNVERIGLYAANRLCELLAEGEHTVGINWGWSVRQCVTNLHPAHPNPLLRFVPIVGNLSLDENDAHFEEAVECSSNRLTQHAAEAFGAPRPPRLNSPAFVPRRFHGDPRNLQAIRDFIESDISYRRIFGGTGEKGLIDEVNCIITGLSSLDVQSLAAYRPNLITDSDLPRLEQAGVVGDLALHLLLDQGEPGENITDDYEGQELVKNINELIVGASPEDFVRVAENTRKEGRSGGVIVLATGPWKARILITAIRLRAVNELITDMETALAISQQLGISREIHSKE